MAGLERENAMIPKEEMSILIVDDIESMCKSIRGMLKVLGVGKKHRFAHSGIEALNLIREVPVDLIISDWNMPGMTGVEMLAQIREDPALRDIPVIMVTAEANREIVAEAAESEIDAYILKPLTVKALGDRITAVLEKVNNPPPMYRHLRKARSLAEGGDLDGAIAETKLAVKADPRSSRPLRKLGHLYYEKKEMDTAEKCLIKAARLNNLDVFAFHLLGEIYLQRNDIDRAADCFEMAMKVSPRHISRGVYFGKVLLQKGMLNRAEKVFDSVLALSGYSQPFVEDIVTHSMAHKAYRYAIKLMQALVELNPDRVDLLCLLAEAYAQVEEWLSALKYYSAAIEKDPDNPDLKLHAAKIYLRIGHALRADQLLSDVLKNDPENKTATELLRQTI